MGTVEKISQQEKFDVSDLSDRWRRARVAAIRRWVESPDVDDAMTAALGVPEVLERELLLRLRPDRREALLRSVFDVSRQLGLSVVRYLGLSWDLDDIAEILPRLGSPCFSGKWRHHNNAKVLQRNACADVGVIGALVCDYWREAVDGLVVGVGEDERLARHKSYGHGDDGCLDVIYSEDFTLPRVVQRGPEADRHTPPKFGPLPPELQRLLAPVQESFASTRVHLALEGLSEGVLFYRLEAEEGVLCGAGGKLLHESLARDVAQLVPGLIIRDVAPLAVYGGST